MAGLQASWWVRADSLIAVVFVLCFTGCGRSYEPVHPEELGIPSAPVTMPVTTGAHDYVVEHGRFSVSPGITSTIRGLSVVLIIDGRERDRVDFDQETAPTDRRVTLSCDGLVKGTHTYEVRLMDQDKVVGYACPKQEFVME